MITSEMPNFLPHNHFDEGSIYIQKIALDNVKRKKFKKGIDFIDNTRYNG